MMSTVDAGADADTAGGGSSSSSSDEAESREGEPSAGDEDGDGGGSTSEVVEPDYYGALGVSEEATPAEIKVWRWRFGAGGREGGGCACCWSRPRVFRDAA